MQGQGGAPLSGADAPEALEDPAPEALDGSGPAASAPGRRPVVVLAVAAVAIVLADVISKAVVVAQLAHRAPVTLIPQVLDLELTRNGGAAFSVGTQATVVFTAVATVVAVVIARTAPRLVSSAWAAVLGLLLGGAVGNLIDRFARAPGPGRGEVVDWIHLHHWPVFNLADSAIVVGAVLAVLLSLRGIPAMSERGSAGS
jgi:signal peptidase II